jgi:hypothetical protein
MSSIFISLQQQGIAFTGNDGACILPTHGFVFYSNSNFTAICSGVLAVAYRSLQKIYIIVETMLAGLLYLHCY